jgi:signal transduction histidine kinase
MKLQEKTMINKKTYNFTKKQLNEEKIKVLSKFASIASHDLKNVLSSLSNVSYYLSKALKVENETQQKMLSMLSTGIVDLNKRISEILDMTRVKQLTKNKCDLQDIILQAISESQIDGIVFENNLISAKAYADFDRMKQVFFNIIKNAKDSMNNNGIISVTMAASDDNIITTIIDRGQGMDEETLESCFDPMFSTKLAKSIGMGLTVARQIVEMHDGSINISSEYQRGTIVVVSIPALKE